MEQLMMGAIAMACWVAGIYFFRFWKETRDRLFAIFGVSFWLLGATRIALAAAPDGNESHSDVYLVRLAAFILILIAIVDKNRPRSRRTVGSESAETI